MNSTPKHRLEHDLLGNREVPETAYYGDHTLRARENFAITGISIGIATALNPYIGYANATEIAAEAHLSGRGVAEIVLERKLMSPEQLADVLRPEVLTRPQMIPAHAARPARLSPNFKRRKTS